MALGRTGQVGMSIDAALCGPVGARVPRTPSEWGNPAAALDVPPSPAKLPVRSQSPLGDVPTVSPDVSACIPISRFRSLGGCDGR
jgi:hypothetical protein